MVTAPVLGGRAGLRPIRNAGGVDEVAWAAMTRLLPYLGPLDGEPEEVDGRHPEHPGQTFDFYAERTGGQRLAIEVTRAADEEWLRDEPAWRSLAERVEAAVRLRHPAVTGV
jgi:hypothetical protein